MPVNRLKSSEDVHADVALTQLSVLSVAPFSVIPPPSAVILVGDATEPSSMFLSSTVIVVELTLVVVPFTVRLPVITTSALLIVAVPVAAPIERVVAAPAKFTVVAVVLTRANVVLPVVREVVTAGEVRVLLVNVSEPARVARVPVVGRVTAVLAVVVSVVVCAPEVVNEPPSVSTLFEDIVRLPAIVKLPVPVRLAIFVVPPYHLKK